ALRYFEAYGIAEGGLIEADPRYWLFLDWTEGLPRTGKPAVLNLLLLEALQRLGELVEASGHVGPLTRVRDLKTALRRSIEDRLWDGDQQRYRDGINASGRHFDTCSLHAQVQAVLCGLRPRWHKHVARGVLSPFLAGTSRETAEPTPYWLTYVYEAARRLGLGRQVVTHLAERWAPMADSGGTWERFEPPGTGETSGSHAWSAHPIHHLPRLLAGVINTEPGWSRIRFEPVLDWAGADRCKAEVPTPHGQVRAAWEREPSSDANTRVELALPAGVTADVHLPRREAEHLSGPGDWTWRVVP
ncbi:MAG: alpha-L-rhamnosidase C-terminal domain-containing protein, partial [Planctomycetota bacterium]